MFVCVCPCVCVFVCVCVGAHLFVCGLVGARRLRRFEERGHQNHHCVFRTRVGLCLRQDPSLGTRGMVGDPRVGRICPACVARTSLILLHRISNRCFRFPVSSVSLFCIAAFSFASSSSSSSFLPPLLPILFSRIVCLMGARTSASSRACRVPLAAP